MHVPHCIYCSVLWSHNWHASTLCLLVHSCSNVRHTYHCLYTLQMKRLMWWQSARDQKGLWLEAIREDVKVRLRHLAHVRTLPHHLHQQRSVATMQNGSVGWVQLVEKTSSQMMNRGEHHTTSSSGNEGMIWSTVSSCWENRSQSLKTTSVLQRWSSFEKQPSSSDTFGSAKRSWNRSMQERRNVRLSYFNG